MKRAGVALLTLAIAAAPAGAAGPAGATDEPVITDAAATQGEDIVPRLVRDILGQETALEGLRATALAAETREAEIAGDLSARRDEITHLLAALQSLSRAPDISAHPQGPLAAARAEIMLAHIRPQLQARAAALATQLRDIETARAERIGAVDGIETGLAALAATHATLGAALDRQRIEPDSATGPAFMRDVDTLSALAQRIAAQRSVTSAPAGSEPTQLLWPVNGRIVADFRTPDAAGVRRPGLILAAAPRALVTAPADGTVRYAGPFLDYGFVVVLEAGQDALIVLAGLSQLDTAEGQSVRAGDLLGLLGGRDLSAQEYLMLDPRRTDETAGETLYIEIRQGQGTVDPGPWLPARNG